MSARAPNREATALTVFHRARSAPPAAVRRVAGFIERAAEPVSRTELPSCGVPIIMIFGEALHVASATGSGRFTAFAAGPHEVPVDTAHPGTLHCLQLDLTPLGAYHLLGVPVCDLHDRVVPLDALADPLWSQLGDRLGELGTWPERFRLLDDVLARAASRGPEPDPEVRWAWHRLARAGGQVPVAELAAVVGWSRRHFTARFHQQIGLPPKAAAQLLRFARARGLLATPGARSISDVAAETGYADHSHLTRAFRRYTGLPPSRLAQ